MNQLTRKVGTGIIRQSPVFDNMPLENQDMSAGVAASFPMLGIKSGKWHYRWKGDDTIISDERGFAVPAINVVILKSQKELSRTYYPPGSYVEGANNRPACYSSDGVKPDDSVLHPCSTICATCPNSTWGSGATAAAPRAQACQQRRRVVLVPYGDDLTNADQGGPCLLSVPPSSLRNQDEYAQMLTDSGVQYFSCITQLSFDQDPKLAFPRIEFSWAAALDDVEGPVVLEVRKSEQIGRILNSKIAIDGPEADGAAAADPTGAPPRTGGSPSESAAPPTPSTARAAPQTVRAAPQPQAPQAPAKMNLGAAKAAPAAATAPVAQPKKIGGFAIKPGLGKQAASDITDAVAAPAAPPPSTRAVRAAPTPEPTAGDAVREDRADGGSVPDELTSEFGSLMGG